MLEAKRNGEVTCVSGSLSGSLAGDVTWPGIYYVQLRSLLSHEGNGELMTLPSHTLSHMVWYAVCESTKPSMLFSEQRWAWFRWEDIAAQANQIWIWRRLAIQFSQKLNYKYFSLLLCVPSVPWSTKMFPRLRSLLQPESSARGRDARFHWSPPRTPAMAELPPTSLRCSPLMQEAPPNLPTPSHFYQPAPSTLLIQVWSAV